MNLALFNNYMEVLYDSCIELNSYYRIYPYFTSDIYNPYMKSLIGKHVMFHNKKFLIQHVSIMFKSVYVSMSDSDGYYVIECIKMVELCSND